MQPWGLGSEVVLFITISEQTLAVSQSISTLVFSNEKKSKAYYVHIMWLITPFLFKVLLEKEMVHAASR